MLNPFKNKIEKPLFRAFLIKTQASAEEITAAKTAPSALKFLSEKSNKFGEMQTNIERDNFRSEKASVPPKDEIINVINGDKE